MCKSLSRDYTQESRIRSRGLVSRIRYGCLKYDTMYQDTIPILTYDGAGSDVETGMFFLQDRNGVAINTVDGGIGIGCFVQVRNNVT